MEQKSSCELLYSVKKVFTEYLDKEAYYNIPDYQRGYKWTKNNVVELLNDIESFRKSFPDPSQDTFYCLQNITCVAKDTEGKKVYNVVDGQQRLTTLAVLLSYLGKSEVIKGKIKYAIREDTHTFITDQIITQNIWESEWESKWKPEHKDQYYLNTVAQAIEEWFGPYTEEEKRSFAETTILKRVKLIVNKLDDGDEEQIFANLNGAKVNLDGADLLRAVMITRAVKEKVSPSQINEFRVRMGMEIDEMNRWWGQKEVNTFFRQMIPEETAKEAKDTFDTAKFPINILYILLYEILKERGGDKDKKTSFSFNFFEYGLDKWELYAELRKLHLEMQDWFYDKHIYHYLGYLFRHKRPIQFSEIYESWRKAASKQDFRNRLKEQIISCVTASYQKDNSQQTQENLCHALYNDIINTSENWYQREDLVNVLVLQDIITILKNDSKSLARLPVNYFTKHTEDKEHIGCRTPNKDDRKAKNNWIDCIDAIKKQYPEVDVERMKAILTNESVSDEQQESVIDALSKYGINSIGNMALLNSGVNRSYGNSPFSEKRLEIIRNYYEGRFIRPHTLKLFIKADCNDPNKLDSWTFTDIERNANCIADSLKKWAEE